MTQVPLENEGKVEGYDGDRGHGDEHGLKVLGANIRDVGYCLAV